MSKKRADAPSGGRLPEVLAAHVDAEFIGYQKFRSLLRTETDSLALSKLWQREDDMEVALILELAKVWRKWRGRKAGTVGTGAGKVPEGKFPFGDWVSDLFKEKGEVPPSPYAIRKALRSVPAAQVEREQLSFKFMKKQ